MTLSVVTIVYNDVKNIEKTINSVLSQTYQKIEYIIIDGASNDGTTDIIKKYDKKIDFWSSEPDNGLYEAMNKGLKKVSGDFVCFLNSGDLFFDNKTVEKIFSSVKKAKDIDIFYGDTVIIDNNENIKGKRRHRPPEKLTKKSFKQGMLVSHQAFIPAMKICPFYDLKYKYSSDYDWCIKILNKADKIHNTKKNIIKYLDGGLTKNKFVQSLFERFKIMCKNYGFLSALWINIRNSIKLFFFALKNRWI